MELNKFLVEAKKNTYAAGTKEIILPDGGRELVYEKGVYRYRDLYYGFNPFSGQEIVWQNGNLIWIMNYSGKARDDFGISTEEIYKNLKKALLEVPEEFPFRGPRLLKLDNFLQYFNKYLGDINSFEGEENISFKGAPTYNLIYHGGLIKTNARN